MRLHNQFNLSDVEITYIAPTASTLFHIELPGATETPAKELFGN